MTQPAIISSRIRAVLKAREQLETVLKFVDDANQKDQYERTISSLMVFEESLCDELQQAVIEVDSK